MGMESGMEKNLPDSTMVILTYKLIEYLPYGIGLLIVGYYLMG
jgi:hypothetical protein